MTAIVSSATSEVTCSWHGCAPSCASHHVIFQGEDWASSDIHTYAVNSAYVVAEIGAAAGLATGLGSALIALRIARSQDASARDLQRRQWLADTLSGCYTEVARTHRQFMLVWMNWWDEINVDRNRQANADRKREMNTQLIQVTAAFTGACAAVRILAPDAVVDVVVKLKDQTFDFDKFAGDHRGLPNEDWDGPLTNEYERLRKDSDNAMLPFFEKARESIQEALGGAAVDS